MTKKILVRGPFLTASGYGEQARFALRSLRSRSDLFDIYAINTNWGQTGWIWEENEERTWFDEIIQKTMIYGQQGGQFDMSLQVTIPNEWEKLAPVNIGYTAGIETDKVAPQWLEKAKLMDRIIVVSNHAADGFNNTAYQAKTPNGQEVTLQNETPITVVNYPVRHFEPAELNLDFDNNFNFLVVAQWGPRKNFENTVRVFLEEFWDDEVGLVVKTSIKNNCLMDRVECGQRLEALLTQAQEQVPDKIRKCRIHLLHGDLTNEEMTALYVHPKIKCLFSLTHGEGFGLPLFEAAYNGLPIIAPNWSGQTDFLNMPKREKKTNKIRNTPMFLVVDHELKPVQPQAVWEGVIQKDSKWAFPKDYKARGCLRTMHKNYGAQKGVAKKLQKHILETFTKEKIYKQFTDVVRGKVEYPETEFVFVNDFLSREVNGGAELSLESLAGAGPSMSVVFKTSNIDKEMIEHYKDKTWVFGNYTQNINLNPDVLKQVQDSGVSYFVVEFDFKACRYRNPVLHEKMEGTACNCSTTDRGKQVKDFLSGAKQVFFMSAEQKRIHVESLGLDDERCTVLGSVFAPEVLDKISELREQYKDTRTPMWVVNDSKSWVKGAEESKQWCKENNKDFITLSGRPYEEALELMASTRGLCFLPTGADTAPRITMEAKLLGLELELNDNVLHKNEKWFDTDDLSVVESHLRDVPKRFWKVIANV